MRPVEILDWRYGQRNMNTHAVLAHPNCLIVIQAFTLANFVDDGRFFPQSFGRDDSGDRTANHLLGGITKYAFGTPVPAPDDACEGFTNDRIVGQFHDRREMLRQLFIALLLGEIDKHIHGANNVTIIVPKQNGEWTERNAAAVGPLGYGFQPSHIPTFAQAHRHGALVMPHRRSVRPVQFP